MKCKPSIGLSFMAVCCAFQDQKQTESIQVLQSQLENVTKLMINLTATVGQLQREVTLFCYSLLFFPLVLQ